MALGEGILFPFLEAEQRGKGGGQPKFIQEKTGIFALASKRKHKIFSALQRFRGQPFPKPKIYRFHGIFLKIPAFSPLLARNFLKIPDFWLQGRQVFGRQEKSKIFDVCSCRFFFDTGHAKHTFQVSWQLAFSMFVHCRLFLQFYVLPGYSKFYVCSNKKYSVYVQLSKTQTLIYFFVVPQAVLDEWGGGQLSS